jgi:NADH:ubiquinone oxidoreductase subunit E
LRALGLKKEKRGKFFCFLLKTLGHFIDTLNFMLYNNDRILRAVFCAQKIRYKQEKIIFKEATMAHLNEAAVKQINAIIDRYVDERTPLMMILSDIQKEYGYIPLEVQELVSERTGVSVAEIYGVVTFYSFFSLKPKGKYVIGVCLGTACYVKGAQQVLDKFAEVLGVPAGGTTEDGLFTLDALRCIGACGIAPAVSINGKVYPKVSVDAIPNIIDEYKALEANA